jgi:uncharacterized protein YndB with AHSA1/START domain
MANLFHNFPIKAPAREVFLAVSSPSGLDAWWTKSSSGVAELGAGYELFFGPGYDWRARVSRCTPNAVFELELILAEDDWTGTRIAFDLEERDGATQVSFAHLGWPESNEHFRVSSFCWAMYLRLLKRFVEHGEVVPYKARLDA